MEKAILVHLAIGQHEKREAEESLDELAQLAAAAGAQVVERVLQRRPKANPGLFVGAGKAEDLAAKKNELGADLVIFDHNLSPTQQRSLEEKIQAKVIDRTQLILDIFAQRARSNEGKLQVELAQLEYLLPRLTGKGVELSRLGAGIGTRGPGEKKLEVDRRRIKERLHRIQGEIEGIHKRRESQRHGRRKGPVPTVSLVGYTSAGKSTLFNALSGAQRLTSPALFATLDPVLRRVDFNDGLYFFLSDTVGFIRKLPVELVSSFRATLEEIREADVLLHVIDISSPRSDEQAGAVDKVLADIGASDVPVIRVINKIDLLPSRDELVARNDAVGDRLAYVSAKTGAGLPRLKAKIRNIAFQDFRLFHLRFPGNKRDMADSLRRWSIVLKSREDGDVLEILVMADSRFMLNYLPYLIEGEENW
jgi:GTPase